MYKIPWLRSFIEGLINKIHYNTNSLKWIMLTVAKNAAKLIYLLILLKIATKYTKKNARVVKHFYTPAH